MIRREITISNKLGLHARAAAKLTQTAGRYPCRVSIERGARKVNAKSIMGVMLLAAGQGSRVRLRLEGPDEAEAMRAAEALFERGFDELESA